MRRRAVILVIAALGLAVTAAAAEAGPRGGNADGIVFRYYPGSGYRFQPLLSFGNLDAFVSKRGVPAVRRLAGALLARGVRRGDALYWPYDFPYGGGAAGWTSGFAQAVAAQALARASVLVGEPDYRQAADAAFRGLRETLLLPLAGGFWIREYSFTREVILNAQLESILAIESYAAIADTPAAHRLAAELERAALRLLPRFELGCWGRYQLGGPAADLHYQTYHVDLLRRLASTHTEPVWRTTYHRWSRCLAGKG